MRFRFGTPTSPVMEEIVIFKMMFSRFIRITALIASLIVKGSVTRTGQSVMGLLEVWVIFHMQSNETDNRGPLRSNSWCISVLFIHVRTEESNDSPSCFYFLLHRLALGILLSWKNICFSCYTILYDEHIHSAFNNGTMLQLKFLKIISWWVQIAHAMVIIFRTDCQIICSITTYIFKHNQSNH